MSKVNRVLLDAREFLADPAHWKAGSMGNSVGPMCLEGAINYFASGDPRAGAYGFGFYSAWPNARNRAKEVVASIVGVDPHGLHRWNDRLYFQRDGHKELLETLDKAIEKTK